MSNKPTHNLTLIVGDGKNARFVRIAGLWPTKDGDGFTGEIPAGVTITGRVAILPVKGGDNGGAQ